jgi:hypothetical protein
MYNYFNQYFFPKVCGMFPEWVCDFAGICTHLDLDVEVQGVPFVEMANTIKENILDIRMVIYRLEVLAM